jgi:hypothetical protein
LSGHGRCTHPDRQHPGVPIAVRAGELNCYRSFGKHDWSPTLIGYSAAPQDILISERPAPFRPTRLTFPVIPDHGNAPSLSD